MEFLEVIFTITPPVPGNDIAISLLADAGFDGFSEDNGVLKGYISTEVFSELPQNYLDSFLPEGFEISWQINKMDSQNWNALWESNFHPVEIEDLCRIRAPFHSPKEGFSLDITIEPQMSFGTGHHQTTWLMVKEMFSIDWEKTGKNVLDMGSGTGILAIVAEKLGAGKILAVDIDQWAYENAKHNIALNDCVNIDVDKGDVRAIAGLTFDVILANINRNILLQDLNAYCDSLAEGGHLLLSGFFSSDCESLMSVAKGNGLTLVNNPMRQEWALLHFIKEHS